MCASYQIILSTKFHTYIPSKTYLSCLVYYHNVISAFYAFSSITCIQFHLLIPPIHFIKHLVCIPPSKHHVQVFHVLLPAFFAFIHQHN
ncbi:hypothetical protein HanPSC8_Chr06g0247241 [Helianthus annuus]|nr:hypothetical protein HanPSC8_Chr06g0247241 [Helianthus annuus]